MLPRTQRQKEILDYITRFLERHGYVPSYTQIARQFGVKSRATIAKHIAALERRGLLTREHEDGSFALNVKVEDTSSESLCEVKLLWRVVRSTVDVQLSQDLWRIVKRDLDGNEEPTCRYFLL